jgi:acyl-coenzyme A thioesterase PaaI-like protein
LTEKPVTQKGLVLLKCPTTTKRELRSLPLTKLNWMEKKLWLKKPMTVKNAHAGVAAAVVDTKAEAAVAAATKAGAAAVAVATNVVTTTAAEVDSSAVMTVAAVDAVTKTVAVAAVTVGNLKRKRFKKAVRHLTDGFFYVLSQPFHPRFSVFQNCFGFGFNSKVETRLDTI